MNLQFQGQEHIARPKDAVWQFISDPKNIAESLPDVIDYTIRDQHSFDANVQVAVGPVRGKFKFAIELQPQPAGDRMNLKIGGGGFGSVLDLLAEADIKADGESTVLDWRGTATVRGPIATLGGRVLDAQARHVIATTFSNINERLSGTAAPPV
jgi:carbon monoxide dehydrogenase subunit G